MKKCLLRTNFSKNLSPKTNSLNKNILLENTRKRNELKDNKYSNLTFNENVNNILKPVIKKKYWIKKDNNEYNQSKINNINK